MVTQAFQDELEVLLVFLTTGAGDEEIVDIYVANVEAMQNFVHEPLERLGCVPEAERHPQEFKQAKWGGHSCLGDVLLCHRDLMICLDQINVCENRGSLQ